MEVEESEVGRRSRRRSGIGISVDSAAGMAATREECDVSLQGANSFPTCPSLLGPKLLLPMGCVKLGEKTIAFTCPLLVNEPQINYSISRNPWEVIILGPVFGDGKRM